MKITKRGLSIFLSVIMLTVVLFYYFGLLQPRLSQYLELKNQNRQLISAVEHYQTSLLNPESTWSISLEHYQEYLYKIPEKPYGPEMIDQLAGLAEGSDVTVKSLNTTYPLHTEEAGDDQVASIAVDLELEGYYYNLMTFLLRVEHADRLYSVLNTTFAGDHDVESQAIFSGTDVRRTGNNIIVLKTKIAAYYDPDNPLNLKGIKKEIFPTEIDKNPFI